MVATHQEETTGWNPVSTTAVAFWWTSIDLIPSFVLPPLRYLASERSCPGRAMYTSALVELASATLA